jgi:hypothetical protein
VVPTNKAAREPIINKRFIAEFLPEHHATSVAAVGIPSMDLANAARHRAKLLWPTSFTAIAVIHSVAVFDRRSGAVHTIGPTASDRTKSPRNEPRNPPILTFRQSTLHHDHRAW